MSDTRTNEPEVADHSDGVSTFAQRWMFGFLIVGMLLVIGEGICLYQERSTLVAARVSINRKTQELIEIAKTLSAVQDAQTSQSGFVLTGNDSYLISYRDVIRELPKKLEDLKTLTEPEPEQAEQVKILARLVQEKLGDIKETIDIYRASGQAAAIHFISTGRGDALMKKIRQRLYAMDSLDREQLSRETTVTAERSEVFSNTFFAIAVSLVLLFIGFSYFMLLYVSVMAKSRRAEELLRQSLMERSKELEAQAQLLDLTHDTILVRDFEGTIRFWNRGAEVAYGYVSEQAVGQVSHELLKTEFPKPLADINRELLASGRWEGEITHFTKDGLKVIVSSRWALKLNQEGQPSAVMEINNDITAQKHAEQLLLQNLQNRSDERLRRVVEAAPNGIMVVDAEGTIAIVNSQIENFFGVERTELLSHSVEPYLPDLLAEIKKWPPESNASPVKKILGSDYELVLRGKDGRNWLVEISISPLVDDGTLYFITSIVDVRARKHAEAGRANMAAIVESSEAAIISQGLDGKVRSWNRSAERVFGYSAPEMIGESINKIIPDDKLEEEFEYITAMKADLKPRHLETVRIRKDGTRFFVAITLSPIRSASGKLIGASKIARDISDRVNALEELKRKVLELERSNEELNQFAYVCSHDLQEPLRVISNFNQLLAKRYKGKLDEKADQFIGFTVDAAKRMQILINDLLMYSRVQNKEKTLCPVECNISVRTALANLKVAIEESGASVDISALPCVLGDKLQLVQLFQNLIANAIKFRSEKELVIKVFAEQKGDDWVFCVADNGIGMDMKFAEKIFIIFQRLHDREAYSGSGIGLAICKKIVQQHSGKIWVESQLGQGTAFYFSFPAALVSAATSI